MTKFKDKILAIQELRAELISNLKDAIKEEMAQYLPEIKSVYIEAYRNYFCDGEPCSYSLRDWSLRLNGHLMESTPDFNQCCKEANITPERLDEIRNNIVDFYTSIPDDILEDFCEDGAIYTDETGVYIEDVDHD